MLYLKDFLFTPLASLSSFWYKSDKNYMIKAYLRSKDREDKVGIGWDI